MVLLLLLSKLVIHFFVVCLFPVLCVDVEINSLFFVALKFSLEGTGRVEREAAGWKSFERIYVRISLSEGDNCW